MLVPISKEAMPTRNGRPPSPMREFASRTVAEFLDVSKPGDVFEASCWPDPDGLGDVAVATRARAELASEAFRRGAREEVRVRRSGARVFLERTGTRVEPGRY